MKWAWSYFALLLLSLSSCTLLRSIEQTNRLRFVQTTLRDVSRKITTEAPGTLPLSATLYPTAYSDHPELDRAYDLSMAQGWKEETISAAFLSQRYEVVLLYGEESSTEYLNSLLCIGNYPEAERLLRVHHITDPATSIMIHLLAGDTARAIEGLKSLADHAPIGIRLNAYRQLTMIPESYREGLTGLEHSATDTGERTLAHTAIHTGSSPRDHAAYTQQLITLPPSWLREYEMLRMRSILLSEKQWTLLYDLHHALPSKYLDDYPYNLLDDYAKEIAILRAYETIDNAEKTIPTSENKSGHTFREVYGNVGNIDNWAMVYSSGIRHHEHQGVTRKPTKEEYNKVNTILGQIF